jgi:DNA primase
MNIEGVGEIDAEELLELLAADNVHEVGSEEMGFSCFYEAGHANGDQNPSAHINRDSLLWRCKGCGRSGNLPELVRLALPHGTTYPEALAWLRENFGEVVRKPRGGSLAADLEQRLARARARSSSPIRRLPEEADTIGPEGIFHMDCRSNHEAAVYMRDRGFAPETLEDWGMGFDHWTQRVAIPILNEHGILVGFKGRSIRPGKSVKYLLLGDTEGRELRYGVGYGFDMHDARVVLFGLDRARDQGQQLVVCEGELDAIACHAAGVTNAVATGTKSITEEQLWLMRAYARAVTFFYDDIAQANLDLFKKISKYFIVHVVDDHEGDPASMDPQEVLELTYGAKHWIRYAIPSSAPV